jgi:GMP synthase-like glutamine amidotransferase
MKPILFVRNDPWETFGVATDAVRAAGGSVRIFDALDAVASAPDVADVSAIVVFGNPFNVEQADEHPFIKDVAELTRSALDRGVPLLGLSFGAQVLAWSLDAEVGRSPEREIGFEPIHPTRATVEDRLLSHYRDGDRVFQWHMDTFEVPEGAELLATGDRVTNQAFRMGERAWGVQFHLEIDGQEIALWTNGFGEERDLKAGWGKSPEDVWEEVRLHLGEHERKGREVFRRFTALARET